MLPRHSSPNAKAARSGLASLLPGGRLGKPSALFISAHPGAEIVAAGGSLDSALDIEFLHVTDGSTRDLADAVEVGFVDRLEYAEARRNEFLAALRFGGFSVDRAAQLHFAAGEIAQNLALVTMSLTAAIKKSSPDVVITHAYEGLHPDQDAVAFAVQAACAVLALEGRSAPRRLEVAGGVNSEGGWTLGRFLTDASTETATARLDAAQLRMKQCMIERMPTLMRQARNAPLGTEMFRVAPEYDFLDTSSIAEPAAAGNQPKRWRRLAADALRVLGLVAA